MENAGGSECGAMWWAKGRGSTAGAASQPLCVPGGGGVWGLFQYEGPQMTLGKKTQQNNKLEVCLHSVYLSCWVIVPGCAGFSGPIPELPSCVIIMLSRHGMRGWSPLGPSGILSVPELQIPFVLAHKEGEKCIAFPGSAFLC